MQGIRAVFTLYFRIIRDTINTAVFKITAKEIHDIRLGIRCSIRCVATNRRYGIIPTCEYVRTFAFNGCFGRRCRFYNRCALIILFAGKNRFVVVSKSNRILRQFFKQRRVNGVTTDCADFRRPTNKFMFLSRRRFSLIFGNATKRQRFFLQYTAVPVLERYGVFAVRFYNECAFTWSKGQGITACTDSSRLHFTVFINRELRTVQLTLQGKRKRLVIL